MKFVIHEGNIKGNSQINGKARQDVYEIAERCGYTPYSVPSTSTDSKGLFKMFIPMKNLNIWMQQLDFFNRGDLLLIQYPLINETTHFDHFLAEAQKRGVYTAAFIHDLNALRYPEEMVGPVKNRKYVQEDGTCLPLFDQVIAHNDEMAEILENIPVEHALTIQLYDYLYNGPVDSWSYSKEAPVVFAGSLDEHTAGFLKELKDINCKFNIYGAQMNETVPENMTYFGQADPEDLLHSIHGSFGLVWQGDSIVDCDNAYGQYLRAASPHKCSMYLASGMPVIVWSESALAQYVEQMKIGFTIHSLYEIEVLMAMITHEEYEELEANAARIGAQLRAGSNLQRVLKEVEEKYETL